MIAFCLPNKSESIFVGHQLDILPKPDHHHDDDVQPRRLKAATTNGRSMPAAAHHTDNNRIDETILVNAKPSSRHSSPVVAFQVRSGHCHDHHHHHHRLHQRVGGVNVGGTPTGGKHGSIGNTPVTIEAYQSQGKSAAPHQHQTNLASSISKCFACCANKPAGKVANKAAAAAAAALEANKSSQHYQSHEKSQNEPVSDEQIERSREAAMLINKPPTPPSSSSLKSRQVNFRRPRPIIIQEIFNHHHSSSSSNNNNSSAVSAKHININRDGSNKSQLERNTRNKKLSQKEAVTAQNRFLNSKK